MSILGISAGFHDAAVSVVDEQGNISFASHSERYSRNKNDKDLCRELLSEVDFDDIDTIAYYEDPIKKQVRQCYAGQKIDWSNITVRHVLKNQGVPFQCNTKIHKYDHHLSHAAAGFQTSPYDVATVVVIDAIGEFTTASIWRAMYDNQGIARYRQIWKQGYPHSLGLFYSAMTKHVGLKPMDEEYIFMGMAAWGENKHFDTIYNDFILNSRDFTFRQNCHAGIDEDYLPGALDIDLAASVQAITEHLVTRLCNRARHSFYSNNLVLMGGVALNCVANSKIDSFDNIWIMPNPGDAGSSLGAAALSYKKKLNWQGPFLGCDIPGEYPVDQLLDLLLEKQIVGVASGRAEFGPRALGNRSLLADPRGDDIKDRVNEIKRRQKFRPFAPMILEEQAQAYFDLPKAWVHSPYMQSVGICKSPKKFPAICHVDNSSRVQTVGKEPEFKHIREMLEKWFILTGCPMLLNTSLNIRGEPIVNTRADADRFEDQYGIDVCS